MKLYHGREYEFTPHPGQFWAVDAGRSSYYAGPDGSLTEAKLSDTVYVRDMGHAFGHQNVDMPSLMEKASSDGVGFLKFPERTAGEDATTYILVDPGAVEDSRTVWMDDLTASERSALEDGGVFPSPKGADDSRQVTQNTLTATIEAYRATSTPRNAPPTSSGKLLVADRSPIPKLVHIPTKRGRGGRETRKR